MPTPAGADRARRVGRHPQDPDPVRATKARAVLALGIVALATSFTVGGIIPAVLALQLARQARADMRASEGFLTGGKLLRIGELLAWAAVVVVATVLVLAAIVGVFRLAPTGA
ncbi:MAG: hypothetical protein ACRDTU_00580 [Micromonosporaceae bacterium]